MSKLRKVQFYLGIGFSGAEHREAMTYPAGTTDEEIQADLDTWATNYLDMGFYDLEEDA